jgi:hypothetical protein
MLPPSYFMGWKTYLVVYFKAGNKKVSEVVKKVESVGFKSSLGPVDFIYEWKNEPTKEQVLKLADNLAEALKGTESMFNIDTHEGP